MEPDVKEVAPMEEESEMSTEVGPDSSDVSLMRWVKRLQNFLSEKNNHNHFLKNLFDGFMKT